MAQFYALCDYIEQGQAQQAETHKKWMSIDVLTCTLKSCILYETCMVLDDEYLSMLTCV